MLFPHAFDHCLLNQHVLTIRDIPGVSSSCSLIAAPFVLGIYNLPELFQETKGKAELLRDTSMSTTKLNYDAVQLRDPSKQIRLLTIDGDGTDGADIQGELSVYDLDQWPPYSAVS